MMLTILGLPPHIKYQDLKVLVKQECNLSDFILDNLVVDDDGCKKVRIGVTDDSDGSHLMKCLNGFRWSGHVIRIVPVGKTSVQPTQSYDSRGYQPRNEFPSQPNTYGNRPPDSQPARQSTWAGNAQWSPNQPPPSQPLPNTFNQPQTPLLSNPYVSTPQPRAQFGQRDSFVPVRGPQQSQGFGYPPKTNQPQEHAVQAAKENFQGPNQFNVGHPPAFQGQDQGFQASHGQPVQWNMQKQPPFDKQTTGAYNQGGYNEKILHKPGMEPLRKGSNDYKDPDRSDHRYTSRNLSPGRRMSPRGRMSPGPQGRRMSPGPQGRRMSPSGRRMSPSGRRMSPSGRRMSPHSAGPHGRRMSPHGFHDRHMSPSGRRLVSPGRKMSPHGIAEHGPPGRAMSPGRRLSPSRPGPGPDRLMSPSHRKGSPNRGRRMSPQGPQGRRMSPGGFGRRVVTGSPPPGRRMSPGVPGRRGSPPRRMSPSDRRMPGRHSPGRRGSPRRMSPHKRVSPGRRPSSPGRRGSPGPPGRRDSPRSSRFSPSGFKHDSMEGRQSNMKQVRPAYESSTTAPNQPMYSGGYRQNIHQNVQYPGTGGRPEHRPWQQDRDNTTIAPSKTLEKFDIPRASDRMRVGDREEPKRSRSRSPVRRERSPIKDRYKRHSPSPRSPRRSWALEKRQSPEVHEAPPPPIWPGQNSRDSDYSKQNRPIFSERIDQNKKKHIPTWDLPPFEEKGVDPGHQKLQPSEDRRPFIQNNPMVVRKDLEKWKPMSQSGNKESSSRNPWDRQDQRVSHSTRESHSFASREEFSRPRADERMQYSDNQDLRKHHLRQEHQDELRHKDDLSRRRDDFSRRDEDRREMFRSTELSKEIEDVYKRVTEFGMKAQEYRKRERFEDKHMDDRFKQSSRDEDMDQRGRDDRKDYRSGPRFEPRDEDRQREPEWVIQDKGKQSLRPRMQLSPAVKAKRDKAAEEITRRIMNKFKDEITDELKTRVHDELILAISRILFDMFRHDDVSYIEMVIKFNAKYDAMDEVKIFEEVMSSFSSHYRTKKRPAQGQPDVPAKTPKFEPNVIQDGPKGNEFHIPDWKPNIIPAINMINATAIPPFGGVPQMPVMINPTPLMVPAPSFIGQPDTGYLRETQSQPTDGYNLYLCKDHLQPFTDIEADVLKNFIVSEMFRVTENTFGWAPEFILKGLQSMYRYEIITRDPRTKDWLLNLDFSNFSLFNVLVYTNEELWYERAAIWLPGHSRCRTFSPFEKLNLQNKHLEGVCVGKWKFVKKVVTVKGSRIYVDMPPSSARALEKHNMMLSYELQKVNVFLKAVAVDKDAFDAGLTEPSVDVLPFMQNIPMPSLGQDNNITKIGLKGDKKLSLEMARKIKDMVVYKLFKYLQQGGNSRTDFIKYGFCSPGYLGIIPENAESKRWLKCLDIGKLNRQPIVIIGGDTQNIKYIATYIPLPIDHNVINSALACEKLKQSNQGVKGINFNYWKNAKITARNGNTRIEVDMDLESLETIAKLNYELDYVDEGLETLSLKVKSDYSISKLEDLMRKYRAEMSDSYVVSNMDLESDSDDDVVCLN